MAFGAIHVTPPDVALLIKALGALKATPGINQRKAIAARDLSIRLRKFGGRTVELYLNTPDD